MRRRTRPTRPEPAPLRPLPRTAQQATVTVLAPRAADLVVTRATGPAAA